MQAALAQLKLAESENGLKGFYAQSVSHRQLEAVIAIAQYQTETQAANALDLSQPAVTRALRDLERMVEQPLFYRTSKGMIPTVRGEQVVRRAKVALVEVASIDPDLQAFDGRMKGRLAIGALPLASTLFVPKAINLTLALHPEIEVTVFEGTYASFLADLRCGDLDLIVGALRPDGLNRDVLQEGLFIDDLVVIARADHPLARRRHVSLQQIVQQDWVIPRRGTPSRERFDSIFEQAGMLPPKRCVEAGSLATVRGLLLESDRLSVASPHQVHFEIRSGTLATLSTRIGKTTRTIGVTTRADSLPTALVSAFIAQLRHVCAGMAAPSHEKVR